MYNSLVRHWENEATSTTRHSQEREMPLPIYLGMMIHTKTRKRELVNILYELGMSISYDRVLDISTELGNKICHHYRMEKAVCPPQLKGGLFTTAAVDNIDHNPSSTRVRMTHSMVLGSPCFSTLTATSLDFLGLLSPRMVIILPRAPTRDLQ